MTDQTTPPNDPTGPTPESGGTSAGSVIESIRDAVEDLAERAAPAVKEFSAKAAEIAAVAADKAAPLARKAGEATAEAQPKGKPKAAAAAPADKEAAKKKKEVDKLYEDARKAAKKKQWDKASDLYLQAFRLEPHWKIAASLGHAETEAGRSRDAAEHLAFALPRLRDDEAHHRAVIAAALADARASGYELDQCGETEDGLRVVHLARVDGAGEERMVRVRELEADVDGAAAP